jgi:hypothetical protein
MVGRQKEGIGMNIGDTLYEAGKLYKIHCSKNHISTVKVTDIDPPENTYPLIRLNCVKCGATAGYLFQGSIKLNKFTFHKTKPFLLFKKWKIKS